MNFRLFVWAPEQDRFCLSLMVICKESSAESNTSKHQFHLSSSAPTIPKANYKGKQLSYLEPVNIQSLYQSLPTNFPMSFIE